MDYINKVLEEVKAKNPNEPEFNQAVMEVLESLRPVIEAHPEYEDMGILERLTEPERAIMFKVPWVDDKGKQRFQSTVQRCYRTIQGRT